MSKIHTASINGRLYQMGYKVLTEDMKSLGLNKNLNIHQYPFNEWYFLPIEDIFPGKDDFGGIWLCRTFGRAYKLAEYMLEKHDTNTRIFKGCLADILYFNDFRIKTKGIKLFDEIK